MINLDVVVARYRAASCGKAVTVKCIIYSQARRFAISVGAMGMSMLGAHMRTLTDSGRYCRSLLLRTRTRICGHNSWIDAESEFRIRTSLMHSRHIHSESKNCATTHSFKL